MSIIGKPYDAEFEDRSALPPGEYGNLTRAVEAAGIVQPVEGIASVVI